MKVETVEYREHVDVTGETIKFLQVIMNQWTREKLETECGKSKLCNVMENKVVIIQRVFHSSAVLGEKESIKYPREKSNNIEKSALNQKLRVYIQIHPI